MKKLLWGNPFPALYGLLLLHWALFVNYGATDFRSFDWYLVHQWLDVAKLALVTHQIPYEVTLWADGGPFSDLFGTKYFGMPFLILSPQILLLSWVSIQTFVTVQVVLTMTGGFFALLWWKRRLGLSDFSAAILILMWSLNGALVARMGVGHLQLTGYFLVPGFLVCLQMLLDSLAGPEGRARRVESALLMAVFLFVVLLQGSVHTVYQMSLILGLFSLLFFRSFKYVMLTFFVFVLLAAYFIIPNVMYGAFPMAAEGELSRLIFGGYGTGFDDAFLAVTGRALPDISLSALSLRNAFVLIPAALLSTSVHLIFALIYPFSARFDASWEYSVYVGPIGFCLMLVGWIGFFRGGEAPGRRLFGEYRRQTLLSVIVFVLSLSVVSGVIWLGLQRLVELNAIDRLPTRLLLYPLLASMLCMSVGLDRLMDRLAGLNRLWIKGLVGTLLAISLLLHSSAWSFHSVSVMSRLAEASARLGKPDFSTSIVEVTEPAYRTAVNTGFGVTLLAIVGVVATIALIRRREAAES